MIQTRLDFVFEPFLKSWKSGQNCKRRESLKMIQKPLDFVFQPFLNSGKSGQNWPKW